MPHLRPEINRRAARGLQLHELEREILEFQRAAVHHHFDAREWADLDYLRKLRTARRKEGGL